MENIAEIAVNGAAVATGKVATKAPQIGREQCCSNCKHFNDDGFLGYCTKGISQYRLECQMFEAS